ncbi:asparagine synthase (glutamine-hydrolyzing) [Pontiella agarivorans]|uniref:asparagine synthase (glutamine-hydrolyzing) n=1 Tax=Pontiella agarivorans TaxID=3038953 RepID=A0ABU5MSY9_9BACT|nr:asparagine synthase (glutamine-hydrolyzing) [Pontiella agarivorans]MDZ8117251.1 asparagine synthase (glutamine-hydrolyzing) [Pontiella agarivorans]
MCGIAGFFSWDSNAPVPSRPLRRASERMALRGPDADGFYEQSGVGFAHRRLTVIDLTGGWQPLEDRASGVCLTYNGEIYNFRELRTQLVGLGHTFETQCDTEVLLHAYLQWGRACTERFVGIFAFAIYDPQEELLFLARDRMGAKPLYYAQTDEGVAFASTVAALRAFDGIGSDIEFDAVLHYFSSIRTTMGSRTLLRDVQTLEAGFQLTARRVNRSVEFQRYWEFPIVPESEKEAPPLSEAVETVRSLVEEAVAGQLVSDVPLGGFLSGGIDSSLIASLASKQGAYGAYNVGYGEHGCNEWPYVRMAAEFAEIQCREIHLNSDGFVDAWIFLMKEKGLPLSTPNEIPIWQLARSLREDYTVALSGEGADEVFGGYVTPYFSAYDFDRAKRKPSDAPGSVERALLRLYGQDCLPGHVAHHFLLNSWMAPATQQVLLQPDLSARFPAVWDFYQGLFDRFEGCSTLDKHMHLHARINLEGLLNRVDSSTMSASVEARVPFTDHRIADYLYRLPNEYRMAWRDESARQQGRVMNVAEIDSRNLVESKLLLRRAFRDEVPPEIMNRRKVSFPVPFREWFGGALRDFAGDTLSSSCLVGEMVQRPVLTELIDGADDPGYAMQLWPLVNLALWEQNGLHPEEGAPDPVASELLNSTCLT